MALLLKKTSVAGRAATARPSVRAAYKVTLKTPSGEQTIECSPDTYILDGECIGHCGPRGRIENRSLLCHPLT